MHKQEIQHKTRTTVELAHRLSCEDERAVI